MGGGLAVTAAVAAAPAVAIGAGVVAGATGIGLAARALYRWLS